MNKLYPLKFEPILKDRIWGGEKLIKLLGKKGTKLNNIGESWEVSGVDDSVSIVSNGYLKGNSVNELVEIYMGDLVGDVVYERFGNQFPLLVKFIDATSDLSIQVHPNDEVAEERHDSLGKTEMWYVMQAEKGANLVSGFKTEVTCQSYLEHLKDNKLMDLLGSYDVQEGDVFLIPAGRIHAIGAGILLVEIQQTSDITYRIFDYNRKDENGKNRELHTDMALDIIEYKKLDNPKIKYLPQINKSTEIVKCEFFTTNIIDLENAIEKDYFGKDSFVIYVCVDGSFIIDAGVDEEFLVSCGETILIPAECKSVKLNPVGKARILEVYI